MTLTCNVLVPSRRLDSPLQFCFFRDSRALWPGWSSSPELQLPKVWREDSGSYWCESKTMAARVTRSPRVQIQVQGECGGLRRGADTVGGTRLISPDTGGSAPAGMEVYQASLLVRVPEGSSLILANPT